MRDLAAMNTDSRPAEEDECADRQIDALLRRDDDASIIDTLLAMPRGADPVAEGDAWERVLFARLQERLARRMRETIEGPRRPRDAA